jgi:hypothetical protein
MTIRTFRVRLTVIYTVVVVFIFSVFAVVIYGSEFTVIFPRPAD